MSLTATSFYDDVRAALGTSLTADDLPDRVLASAPYRQAALRDVMARDPLYATRTDTDEANLQLAAVLLTAAYVAPQLPILARETDDTGYQIARQPVDLLALAASLRQRAEAALAQVLDVGDLTPYRPTFFAVACGRRGA